MHVARFKLQIALSHCTFYRFIYFIVYSLIASERFICRGWWLSGGEFAHWTRFQFWMDHLCIISHKICINMRSEITFHRFALICVSVIWLDVLIQPRPVRQQSVAECFVSSCSWLCERNSNSTELANCSIIVMRTNYLDISVHGTAFNMSDGLCSGENGRNFSKSQRGKKFQKKYFLRNYLLFSTVNFTIIIYKFHCVLSVLVVQLESRTMLWQNHNICIHKLLEFSASDIFCMQHTHFGNFVLSTSFLHRSAGGIVKP